MPEPTSIALFSVGGGGLILRLLRNQYRRAKPWVDRLGAALLAVVFSPVMAACALLIKLTSRGPVFYTQERVGKGGRVFTLIKLRTMYQNAEAETGPTWARGDHEDPRVTPVGRILRKTHLDEVPQLINVLKGEMSLIGPRPERPCFVEEFKEEVTDYDRRLTVKPGITGLAQIRSGYDRTLRDVRRKVRLDCLYIRRRCWMVDASILWHTAADLVRLKEKRNGSDRNLDQATN